MWGGGEVGEGYASRQGALRQSTPLLLAIYVYTVLAVDSCSSEMAALKTCKGLSTIFCFFL